MKVACTLGTRPEAIKMAPVILALRDQPGIQVTVLATAQHREMLDQVLTLFGIMPDADLNIMRHNQALPELTARLLVALDGYLAETRPDIVLAQGDTTTVLMAALASFYRKIRFGHVEAGLRTGNLYYPFPEELNRVLTGHIAALHFAPTARARDNLLREGIHPASIFVTGNTVIDALIQVASRDIPIGYELDPGKRLIVVTAHRRENFGEPFLNICRAIRAIADRNEDVQVLYPVHPNPNIAPVAWRELGTHPRIVLSQPLDYGPFVSAVKRSYLILTDSGGVQEEAPALAKPVLVLRAETERPEALAEGVVKLIGTDTGRIIDEVQTLLDDESAYRAMARGVSPYGDGHAAARIIRILRDFLR